MSAGVQIPRHRDPAFAPRIGWIGLGQMGLPMARNLHRAGFDLTVFNRSPRPAIELANEGVKVASTPQQIGKTCDIIFTMVADDTALANIIDGDCGLSASSMRGRVLVDMSTISVTGSAKIAATATGQGFAYVRAPVSGSTEFARAAKLTILVSGVSEDIDRCRAQFEALGNRLIVVGLAEEARVVKLALNLMIGTTAASLAEALLLGELGGVEWGTMIDVIANSAVASPFVTYKLSKLQRRDFRPDFRADQIAKDFGLAFECAGEKSPALRVAHAGMSYWREMREAKLGEYDLVGCLELIERIAGLSPAESKSSDWT